METLIFVALFIAFVRQFFKKRIYFVSICLSYSEVISFSSWEKDHRKQMSTPIVQFVQELGQTVTSSVTDVVLSPTVPSVYFLTVKFI